MEVCEKNNCDSSASKQSCDASVKRMNRGSISELLQCDFKICFSLNPFAVIFAFFPELGWLYLSLSFELNWCECWKLTVGLCVERPDGECASRQRSEVTDSCFLAELRWRRGHGAAANTHTHTHIRAAFVTKAKNIQYTVAALWNWVISQCIFTESETLTHDAPSPQSILINSEWNVNNI